MRVGSGLYNSYELQYWTCRSATIINPRPKANHYPSDAKHAINVRAHSIWPPLASSSFLHSFRPLICIPSTKLFQSIARVLAIFLNEKVLYTLALSDATPVADNLIVSIIVTTEFKSLFLFIGGWRSLQDLSQRLPNITLLKSPKTVRNLVLSLL